LIFCVSPGGIDLGSSIAPPMELRIGTVDGVYALERNPTTAGWIVSGNSLTGNHVSSLAYLAEPSLLLAGLYGGGLLVSTDEGRSWSAAADGIAAEHRRIETLALQQREGTSILWAGTEPAALYRSDDLGRHWERVAHFTDATAVRRIVIHPADPQTLYVCVEGGALRKSTDGGRAWHPLSYEDATYLAVGRNPAKLIVAGRSGLAISDDGGETWTQVNTVPGIGSFFLDPRDENVLYLAYGGSIVRSDDAGATWTELRNGLPDDVRGTVGGFSMFRWTRTAGLYVATADGDAYSSEERGTEWEVMARGLPPVYRSSVSS
jgi:photosystem II stability/assembly factor-like uncharacterized protein